jgi:hypothetical protein
MSVLVLALPIYYVWKWVASFRPKAISHWPPAVCLGLWLLQWTFFLVSAAGCMGGGCADPKRNWLECIGILTYNWGAAYWLWRWSGTEVPQGEII